MPNIGNWMGWNDLGNAEAWLDVADRGSTVAFILGHRGVSIALNRAGATIAAQTMIVAPFGQGNTTNDMRSDAGTSGRDEVLIVGLVNLNIQRNDEFAYNSGGARRNYKVTWVNKAFVGMVQARAEVLDRG